MRINLLMILPLALFGVPAPSSATETQQEEVTEKVVGCFLKPSVDEKSECIGDAIPGEDKSKLRSSSKACLAKSSMENQILCLADLIQSGTDTASTKEARKSIVPGDYRKVDPKDLQLGPRKFIGKPIELWGMQCFYADLDEYRCFSKGASMTVFAPTIVDYPDKDSFDDVCGRQKNVDKPICRRTIRIVPTDWSQDSPSAFGKRTIIKADELRFVAEPKSRRR